jgi:hypothetical protein
MTRFLAIRVLALTGVLRGTLGLGEPLECASGWKNGEVLVIPDEWVNDGYCDCPLDGRDEPDTDACSGSDAWPGLRSSGER